MRSKSLHVPTIVSLLLVATLLPGCGDDNPTEPTASDYYGDYNLDALAIDDSSPPQSLPVVVEQYEDETIEITAGSMSLMSNHRFIGAIVVRMSATGQSPSTATELFQGDFTAAGESFVFKFDDDSSADGFGDLVSWSSGRTALRLINDDGVQFFFVRD